MSTERMETLAAYLNADEERTVALLELEPAEAAAKINADGYDFTAEELARFGASVEAAAQQGEGELELDQLDDVSGGIGVIAMPFGGFDFSGIVTRKIKKIW